MKRVLHIARIVLRRARDLFPLTLLGLAIGGGSALALFHYGLDRIDLVLLVVGVVGLGLVSVCTLLTLVVTLVMWLKLRRMPEAPLVNLECGFPRRTGFSVGSPWFVPFVRVGWTWISPEARVRHHRRGLRVDEEVIATRRTLRDNIVRCLEVSDSFGLTRVSFRITEPRPLRFVPSHGALRQMHVIRSMAAGEELPHPDGPAEGERADIRRYVAGDPVRYILWKVFARTREVVVRTPERAIGPVHQTVAYLVTGEGDEPAAGAARVAVESGALGGGWVLGADGAEGHVSSSHEALDLLARSGDAPPGEGGVGLADFLRTATPGGRGRALVFVPARPGPWLDRVLATVGASRGTLPAVEFIVCADGVNRSPGPRAIRRFALRSDEPFDPRRGIGPTSASDLAQVCKKLAATRAGVLVLDRVEGRVYSQAHQKSLEAA